MSTVSFEYSQPDAYHFCQDSILAPREIARDLRDADVERALDVCAGCGVMGFELMHALGRSLPFDFLDVQDDFEPHFRRNLEITGFKGTWISANYSVLSSPEWSERYDLIVANPPYFFEQEGSLSASPLNNRARFFLDADLKTLLRGVRNTLRPKGRAYLLMKSGKQHGRDAFTSARIELFDCHLERLADIRGTDLVRITKA
jgi:tRNA1(Val) A37 N6-methylase TrmN6